MACAKTYNTSFSYDSNKFGLKLANTYFKMSHVDHIKPYKRCKQSDVGFGDLMTRQVSMLRQYSFNLQNSSFL